MVYSLFSVRAISMARLMSRFCEDLSPSPAGESKRSAAFGCPVQGMAGRYLRHRTYGARHYRTSLITTVPFSFASSMIVGSPAALSSLNV